MEADRAETNLGPTSDDQLVPPEPAIEPKRPKRRFVGKKAADADAQNGKADGAIEESGAIQGRFITEHVAVFPFSKTMRQSPSLAASLVP